jgi:enolase-phosphatase E1
VSPLDGIRGVLIDVEGTTTPIAFVRDTLFPFAAARVGGALARAATDRRTAEALALLRAEHARAGDAEPFGDGVAYVKRLIAEDRKSTGLKALQGVIWEEGYLSGVLSAPVFDDVPPALRRWRAAGLEVRVFSSGSVLAQRLLFAHTDHGDLTPLFAGYHDTTTGPKREAHSSRAIAEAFRISAAGLLYLSAVGAELAAAREAGYRTGLLERPGNAPEPARTHPAYPDFSAIG